MLGDRIDIQVNGTHEELGSISTQKWQTNIESYKDSTIEKRMSFPQSIAVTGYLYAEHEPRHRLQSVHENSKWNAIF